MARHRRIEYPGAIHHVINRGNYRSDVFGSTGAATAFVATLEEAVKRYEWELGAYVVMRNHFHLAVRTPHPNLSDGMHWLQVTFATRFNRLRGESGHLFQGRFKSFLLQDEEVWSRVADYIHLNPLRAKIVETEHLASFRWSSLARFTQDKRFDGLVAAPWLATLGWRDSPSGWADYLAYLQDRYAIEEGLPPEERESYSTGWAIGEDDWKNGLLEQIAEQPDGAAAAEYQDPGELQRLRWEARLQELLAAGGNAEKDLQGRLNGIRWKVRIADQLQREMGVPVVWLAKMLNWGRPASVRTSLWRYRKMLTK